METALKDGEASLNLETSEVVQPASTNTSESNYWTSNKYPSLSDKAGLQFLEKLLLDQSYVSGHSPGLPDLQVYNALSGKKLAEYENICRWQRNIKSYECEFASWRQSLDKCDGSSSDQSSANIRKVKLTPAMISVKRYEKKVHVEEIIPSVIEPSFGIGRVMYALFEHNFRVREEDEQRTYFTLPPVIAPLKCSVLPLSNNVEFSPLVAKVSEELTENDVSHKVDDSAGSIGKRYARTDEVAVPFGITIDFESLKEPHSVTLRERDTTSQVRIEVDKVGEVLRQLSIGRLTWDQEDIIHTI
jgi:glycyl-tRNA synthetase (class II)